MPAQIENAPARRARTPKSGKPSRPTLTEATSAVTDRTPDGRYAKNNPGGPGNPHARHCARMLALLRTSISDEHMVAIIRKLVEKACAGDVSAAKLLLSYQLGKPAAAPNPDAIDRDEWEHYQRDAIHLQEVQQVLGSLPARVGNDIARTALPIMTQARTRELATQLRAGCPIPAEVTVPVVDATSEQNKATYHENASRETRAEKVVSGRAARQCKSQQVESRISHARSLTNDSRPTSNTARSTRHAARSTPGARASHSPPATPEAPIPNRKSKLGKKGKARSKKLEPAWLQQMARRVRKSGKQ